MSNENENWMRDLPNTLHSMPLIYLAIPGSHDTMTYSIKKNSGIAPDATKEVKILSKIFGPLAKRIVYNWSVTQHLNITDQLNMGVRYLDLRVSSKSGDSNLYFVHAMFAGEVKTRLEEVNGFLNAHPSECLIIDFQHFYSFTKETHVQLIQIITEVFGNKLCVQPNPVTRLSLKWMWSNRYQVIVIYRNDIIFSIDKGKRLWSGTLWPTFWPDTTSVSKLIEYCDRILEHRDQYFGLITQCLVTPDAKFVVKNIFSDLFSKCARPCNTVVKSWIAKKQPGEHGVNVIIADFISMDGFEFCSTVIALNRKLLGVHTSRIHGGHEPHTMYSLPQPS
uniref:PI-PLC X domain-containing protein 3 n=2 Tax=Cacopsylla melanoneura TaxID=428564 RepID=A0A8D8VD77_9HEMI